MYHVTTFDESFVLFVTLPLFCCVWEVTRLLLPATHVSSTLRFRGSKQSSHTFIMQDRPILHHDAETNRSSNVIAQKLAKSLNGFIYLRQLLFIPVAAEMSNCTALLVSIQKCWRYDINITVQCRTRTASQWRTQKCRWGEEVDPDSDQIRHFICQQ